MSDIVKRDRQRQDLRALADVVALANEAAAEIERLRAALLLINKEGGCSIDRETARRALEDK